MTTSTLLIPKADAIAAVASTVVVTYSNGTATLTGYTFEPVYLELPAAAVGVPNVRRTEIDEPESQLGSLDWFMEYPVSLYFKLDEAATAQSVMVEALESFIEAIDAAPSLNDSATMEAKVTRAEPFVGQRGDERLCGYECTVEVYQLV